MLAATISLILGNIISVGSQFLYDPASNRALSHGALTDSDFVVAVFFWLNQILKTTFLDAIVSLATTPFSRSVRL